MIETTKDIGGVPLAFAAGGVGKASLSEGWVPGPAGLGWALAFAFLIREMGMMPSLLSCPEEPPFWGRGVSGR